MSIALLGARVARTFRHTIDAVSDARTIGPAGTRHRAHIVQRTCAALLDTYGIRLEVIGPRPSGQALLVSNHLGWLDPLIVGALHPCLALAKREVSEWPVIGSQARALGTIFVDRGDAIRRAMALRSARRLMLEGASIMNFPEGTTTRGDVVLPFRRGLFGVAHSLGVPIIPMRIDYDDRSMAWVDDETFLPHFFSLARRSHANVTVHLAPPLPIKPREDAQTIADRARKVVQFIHLS